MRQRRLQRRLSAVQDVLLEVEDVVEAVDVAALLPVQQVLDDKRRRGCGRLAALMPRVYGGLLGSGKR